VTEQPDDRSTHAEADERRTNRQAHGDDRTEGEHEDYDRGDNAKRFRRGKLELAEHPAAIFDLQLAAIGLSQ